MTMPPLSRARLPRIQRERCHVCCRESECGRPPGVLELGCSGSVKWGALGVRLAWGLVAELPSVWELCVLGRGVAAVSGGRGGDVAQGPLEWLGAQERKTSTFDEEVPSSGLSSFTPGHAAGKGGPGHCSRSC